MNSVRTGSRRRRRSTAAGAAVLTAVLVITVLVVVLVIGAIAQAAQHAAPSAQQGQSVEQVDDAANSDREVTGEDGLITGEDGLIRDGEQVGPWSDVPAVTNLDPGLLAALRSAAEDAAADGVELRLNSGWRTAEYQDRLLQDATAEYGTAEQAARWVATPDASEHVSGEAVDIGPWRAAQWLADNGAAHDLCQVYANEAWHFELRPGASGAGCPPMYADAAERR